ncbi:ATP synthase subunit s, mitochondrial isoform X1 [Cimex lectularius]|uniref:Mitochondrial ATP synthase regulatory component factor B n=1 Tax=Cimex lectularius TaxID=79782 RepID=A0A8I6S0A8_CIMLE|nr:ATP synthase subunit s, mitochondrial isoform X1 [Cimex lectularius]
MWIPTSVKALQHCKSLTSPPKREFFASLNFIFNRVSAERVKEVGPDRACAEWLMKNGAFIRWIGNSDFVGHYNSLPLDPKLTGNYNIEEVKADQASISHHGFDHFKGCKHIRIMTLHDCWFVDNMAIAKLRFLKDSLTCLTITNCQEITDEGLLKISNLVNLQDFTFGNMMNLKNPDKIASDIREAIPGCIVTQVDQVE